MAQNRRMRILLASAMPDHPTLTGEDGQGRLFHAGSKTRALAHRLRPLIEHQRVSLVVEPAVRADHVTRLLEAHRPHILHIVCHGTTSEGGKRALVLEDRRGQGILVDAAALRDAFTTASWTDHLLIAEACGSLPVVEELVAWGVIPAAIGVRDSIDPQASTRFFVTLHAALAAGCTVREAFADARRDLELLAPSIWELPVLVVGKADPAREPRVVLGAPELDEIEIDPTRAEGLVHMAAPLARPLACLGRRDELARLDEAWATATTPIVHLRGAVGMGKTTLLSRWLGERASRRFRGTTQVFTWSFDPRARGAGCGSIEEFLEQALDFFGALEPTLIATRHDAEDRGPWLDGLRLGRCLRYQHALLCLDGVPLLPCGTATSLPPQRVLPPAIAALLLELSRGSLATCVLSTRAASKLSLLGAKDLELGPLSEDAAVELLAQRGVLARREELVRLSTSFGGHPGRLAIAADAAKVSIAWGPRALPVDLSTVLEWIGDDALIDGLVAGGGRLGPDELRALMASNAEPDDQAGWRGLADASLMALGRARALGVIRLTDDGGLVLIENTWLEHVAPDPSTCAVLWQHPSRRVAVPLERLDQAAVYRDAVRAAVLAHDAERAVEIYVDLVCRRGRDRYEQSYLARKLGGIAEEFSVASELFVPGPGNAFVGEALHPGVAEADPPAGAFLLHRVGLCLRHLGSLRESRAPLVRAFERYDGAGAGYEERAATCANDLAELHIARGEHELALAWAEKAVSRADRAEEGGAPSKQALLAQFLCHATLGSVHHRRRNVERAATHFERAEEYVRLYRQEDSEHLKKLYSRPGHQQWCFILDDLSARLAGGFDDAVHTSETTEITKRLLEHLRWAEGWVKTGEVARVSRAYHHLARGHLGLLVDDGLPAPPDPETPWLQQSQRDLFAAVHILRANQHLWMLPEALEARAQLFDRLKEGMSAEMDRDEVRWLEALLQEQDAMAS